MLGPAEQYRSTTQAILDFMQYLVAADDDKKSSGNLFDHLPLISELVFQRFVDNFITYISDLLTVVFTARPEMLKSDEKISVKEVLEYETRSDLIAILTERKITALSFKGLTDLSEEVSKKHGVVLFATAGELASAAILVEKRNLIAHNRAIVNRRYLERVPFPSEKIGERLSLSIEQVLAEQGVLGHLVSEMHIRVMGKFVWPYEAKTERPIVGVSPLVGQ